MFEIIFQKLRYFKCEIKTTSRWQLDRIGLNGWFFQEQNTACCSETQNRAAAVFEMILLEK